MSAEAFPAGWGYRPIRADRARIRQPRPYAESATRRILRDLHGQPDLLAGLKATDLADRYRIHKSVAYRALQRAKRLEAGRG